MSSLKDCAKKKSFQDILTAQVKVFYDLNFLNFAPVVDGYFMPGKSGSLQNSLLRKQDECMHDSRSVGSWSFKGTEESTEGKGLLLPLKQPQTSSSLCNNFKV